MSEKRRRRAQPRVMRSTLRSRVVQVWVQYPGLDWFAFLIPISWIIVTLKFDMPHFYVEVTPDLRKTLYQAMLGASATFAGFTLTSVSVLINLLRTPLSSIDDLFTDKVKGRVGSVFVAAIPVLGGLFLVSLIGLLTDSTRVHGNWLIQAFEIASIVSSALAIARILWVVRRLLVVTRSGS